jgi:hypothetical protein
MNYYSNSHAAMKAESYGKITLEVGGATTVNRTVPVRRPNSAMRTREYLTDAEVARLTKSGFRQPLGGYASPCLWICAGQQGA